MASKSVTRFRAALAEAGLTDTVVTMDGSTRTAEEAAAALGCEVGQIVKSLVLRDAADTPVLVLAAGDRRVDEARVGALHGSDVSLGGARFVRAATGYAIGGVPPFGHPTPLSTILDESLGRWDRLWAAAGTPHTVFCITPVDLPRITGGAFAAVSRPTRPGGDVL